MEKNTHDFIIFFLSSAGIALLICYLGARKTTSFYGRLISHPRRFAALDGLRGVLAFYVCVYHVTFVYYIHTCGFWDCGPIPHALRATGEITVSLFFLTTGFLFWLRAVEGKKRPPVLRYYWGRLFRLGPIYVLYSIPILIMIGVTSNWALRVPGIDLGQQIATAMAAGIFRLPDINRIMNTFQLNGALWTLQWEWKFYFCFPFAAMACFWISSKVWRQSYALLISVAVFLGAVMFPDYNLIVYFAWGMLAAQIVSLLPNLSFMQHRFVTLLQIVIFAVAVGSQASFIWHLDMNQPSAAALTGLAFLLFLPVAYGNSFFNFLTSTAAQCLGQITYSVYVSHFILLQCLLFFIDSRGIKLPALPLYYLYANLVVAAIVTLALFTFRFVEYPLMHVSFPDFFLRSEAAAQPAPHVSGDRVT